MPPSLKQHFATALLAFATVTLLGTLLACRGSQPPTAPEQTTKHLSVTGAGAALERITSEPITEMHPAISPDGRLLLFEVRVYETGRSDPAQQTLVGVDPNTRGQRTLFTSANSLSDHPAWLPDQTSYVYASNSPGQWSLVRALTAAPNAAINVIASGEIAPEASWPTVSPDGKRVAFATMVRGRSNIAVIGLDGSQLTLLGEGSTPTWSPDGLALAFSRTVGEHEHLFLVNPHTGTDLVQLTSGEYDHWSPTWSPDGRFIAFSTNRGWNRFPGATSATVRNLYVLNRDGTGLTQVTDGDSASGQPHWGRDNWIYFSSDQAGNADIWRLRPAGGYANLMAIPPVAAPQSPPAQALSPGPSPSVPAGPAPSGGGAATPSSQPAGCNKDTDCKGDRICVKGECTSPK